MGLIRGPLDETYRLLLVASEVAPFAKTGGLADVAGSLPKALAALGNDVRVVLPRYRGVEKGRTLMDLPVQVGDRKATCIVRETTIRARTDDGETAVPVYLVDNYHYFDRERLYGFWDDGERFAFFCRAVLQTLVHLDFQPDVIHCNDWQTGPICALVATQHRPQQDPFFQHTATVYTVHNLQYQGNFPGSAIRLLGIDERHFHPEGLEFFGQVSFMKAGLVYADVINTVSKTYAREIQQPEYGYGMDGVLRARARDLYGILNGINYHEFNPETDPRIYQNFSLDSFHKKRENKQGLQREVGLPISDAPLIGIVSRLADQKGFDLVARVVDQLAQVDLQLVVLGTGDPDYERLFRSLQRRYPNRIAVTIGFDTVLAQRIYAGADLFLMPSRFEPCGLGQMIALRYGTIPIVRATGGLADTITDYDPASGTGNGFTFKAYDAGQLLQAIRRALEVYRDPDRWRRLVETALRSDHSWNHSAVEYMGLYANAQAKLRAVAAAR